MSTTSQAGTSTAFQARVERIGERFIVRLPDEASGALTARNPYHLEFGGRIAFLASDAAVQTFTCDRAEFLGTGGSSNTRVDQIGKAVGEYLRSRHIVVPAELQRHQILEITAADLG